MERPGFVDLVPGEARVGRATVTNVFERAGENRMTPPGIARASDDSCNNAQLTPQSARGG